MEQNLKLQRLESFKSREDSLRIGASKVAALTGFHPWLSLPRLLCDLVYQGLTGHELLLHDSNLLGISLVNEEQQLLELAKKASAETYQAAQAALLVKSGQKVVDSNQAAERLKRLVAREAKKSKRLKEEEMKALNDSARSFVNTGYGTRHEAEALNLYQQQCGWEIRQKNSEVLSWPFRRLGRDTAEPMAKARACRKNKPENIVIDSPEPEEVMQWTSSQIEDLMSTGFGESTVFRPPEKPFFFIAGAVDGILEELWFREVPSVEQEEVEWLLRKVIVECKHRMANARVPPPFYDQIQAVTYSLMYETDRADIIQVLRRERQHHQAAKEKRKHSEVEKKEQPCTASDEPSLKKIPDIPSPNKAVMPRIANKKQQENTSSPKRKMPDYFSPKKAGSATRIAEEPQNTEEPKTERLTPFESSRIPGDLITTPVGNPREVKRDTDAVANQTGDIDKVLKAIESLSPDLSERVLRRKEALEVPQGFAPIVQNSQSDATKSMSFRMDTKNQKDNPESEASQGAPKEEAQVVGTVASAAMNMDVTCTTDSAKSDVRGLKGLEREDPAASANDLRSRSGSRNNSEQKDGRCTVSTGGFEAGSSMSLLAATGEQSPSSLLTIEIVVSRIELDDPVTQHRNNWGIVVLPRLRSFVDAVYRVRSDDGKRYALLAALASSIDKTTSSREAWDMLHAECPWLVHCDTSYQRECSQKMAAVD